MIAWAAGQSGLTTVWQNQDAPRPTMPYVTLHLLNRAILDSTPSYGPLISGIVQGTQTIERAYSYTLNVQVFSSTVDDAFARAEALASSIDKRSVLDDFLVAHIGILSVGPVLDIPKVVGLGWESRASFDIVFSTIGSITDTVQWVSSFSVTGVIT